MSFVVLNFCVIHCESSAFSFTVILSQVSKVIILMSHPSLIDTFCTHYDCIVTIMIELPI